MSGAEAVVWIFGMFFLTILVGLGMCLVAFKDKQKSEATEKPHNPQLESAETIPMRVGARP